MNRRPVVALVPLALLGVLPAAPAAATHSDCTWGAHASVDPFAPEPVDYGVLAPVWGCPGPDVRVTVMGEEIVATREDEAAERSHAAPPASPAEPARWLKMAISPRRARAGRLLRLQLTAAWTGDGRLRPARGLILRAAGRSTRTGGSGKAVLRLRPRRAGRLSAVVLDGRARLATATVTVSGRSRSRATP